jgi:hypothetical protein
MPTASNNVRVVGKSGRHLLVLSSSQFDPMQTFQADDAPTRLWATEMSGGRWSRKISAAGGRRRGERPGSQYSLTVYYLLCRPLPVVRIGIIPEIIANIVFAAQHGTDLLVGIDIA